MDIENKVLTINTKNIINFQSEKIINKGAGSTIYDVISHPGVCCLGRRVAVKISEFHNDLKKESSILSRLCHRHVITLLSVLTNQEERKEVVYGLVLEHLEGPDLYQLVNSKGCPEEKHVIIYAKCILSALRYLGQSKVTHGDVNLYNMVLTCSGQEVKLIDFGCANIFNDNDDKFRESVIFDLTYFGSSMLELLTGQTFETCHRDWFNQSSLTAQEMNSLKEIDDLLKPDFKDPKLTQAASDFIERLMRLRDYHSDKKRSAVCGMQGQPRDVETCIDDVYETFIGHKFLKISDDIDVVNMEEDFILQRIAV